MRHMTAGNYGVKKHIALTESQGREHGLRVTANLPDWNYSAAAPDPIRSEDITCWGDGRGLTLPCQRFRSVRIKNCTIQCPGIDHQSSIGRAGSVCDIRQIGSQKTLLREDAKLIDAQSASGGILVAQHPLAIARDQINFQVRFRTLFQMLERGDLNRVRNEIDRELAAGSGIGDTIDCQ